MAMKDYKGLGWRRWGDPIESFVRKCGHLTPRWAVIGTYEFDADRLERDVLPLLSRRGRIFRTIVLADAGTLQQRLKTGKTPCGRINLHPVRLLHGGIFHPKFVFLRAGNRVRVCFGSANVTSGGMGGNLELWADSEEPELTGAFANFLKRLLRHGEIALDLPARRALQRSLLGIQSRESASFWCSLDEPFTSRLKRKNSGLSAAKRIHLLSPAYASKGGAEAVLKTFTQRPTTIYTDGAIANAEAKYLLYSPPLLDDTESISSEDDTSMPRPSKLHAKAYLLEGRNEGVFWFGSANLTAKALLLTVPKGGNAEILVKTKLPGVELRKFLADLKQQFTPSVAKGRIDKPPKEPQPSHRGVVLSGEIEEREGRLRLVVHTLPGVHSVELLLNGRSKHVVIQNGRGVIKNVNGLIPSLAEGRGGDNWSSVIYEVTKGERIPVLVNVPIIPESAPDGPGAEQAVDSWIDELLGRWPPRSRVQKKTDVIAPEEEDEEDPTIEEEEQRRLDEVDHQGALDRLAVKSAIIKKRIESAPVTGGYRQSLERAVGESLLKACEPHLREIVRSWFPCLRIQKGHK